MELFSDPSDNNNNHMPSSMLQVKCYGPGLESTGCIVNKPAEFTIDAQGAGRGQLKIYAQVSNFIYLFLLQFSIIKSRFSSL